MCDGEVLYRIVRWQMQPCTCTWYIYIIIYLIIAGVSLKLMVCVLIINKLFQNYCYSTFK